MAEHFMNEHEKERFLWIITGIKDAAMKKAPTFLSAAFFIALLLQGCNNAEHQIVGQLISHTTCKSSKTPAIYAETPDTLSCMNYYYDSHGKILLLDHINAGFNCCPGEITCSFSESGDTITITEREQSSLCDCNCLFDLKIELGNIESRAYVIKVIEPYCGKQEKLVFTFDPDVSSAGSVCAKRKLYPWGMSQYSK